MTEIIRVAIDSNLLFSAIHKDKSAFLEFWNIPSIEILVSQYVIGEVSRHLVKPDQRARLWRILYRSHLIPDGSEVILPLALPLPAKDRPILQSAIAGEAHLLVTGDLRHFTPLFGKTIGGVLLEETATFKARYPVHFPQERSGK